MLHMPMRETFLSSGFKDLESAANVALAGNFELIKERKKHCSLTKIQPKKRKRYSQKICVHCRQNHGVRKDTRYICTLCDVALCKEPCFAEYHYNK